MNRKPPQTVAEYERDRRAMLAAISRERDPKTHTIACERGSAWWRSHDSSWSGADETRFRIERRKAERMLA